MKEAPRNVEAENAIIGCVLRYGEAGIAAIADIVQPEHFWATQNRLLLLAALSAMEKGPVTRVTVRAELEKSGSLAEAGGVQGLDQIVNQAITPTQAPRHAELVRDAAMRRALIQTADQMRESAFQMQDSASVILETATENLIQASREAQDTTPSGIGDLLSVTMRDIEKGASYVDGLATGYYDLDSTIGGFRPGEMIVLAARPSMGKTSLALNIASRVAKDGGRVLFVSLEMSEKQLATNLMALRCGINSRNIGRRCVQDHELDRMAKESSAAAREALYIVEPSSLTPAGLHLAVRRMRQPSLIVVDYLQLMHIEGKQESRQVEVGKISRAIKATARKANVPILALAQLNRGIETRSREDRTPRLSDLRESGAIEQDADVVMLLHCEDRYNPTADNKELAQVIVAKNRNGATGSTTLRFVREHNRFESWQGRYEQVVG